jgi:hypothetical protein
VILEVALSKIQIRSCSSIQPTNSTGQSVLEYGSSYRTNNEDIPSKFVTKFIGFKNKINKFDMIALSFFLPYFIQENLPNHGILAHLLMNVKIVLRKYGSMKKEQ